MKKTDNTIIKKSDLERCLNNYFNFNLDDLISSQLRARYKDEIWHKGYLACLLCFSRTFNIPIKNVDKLEIIDYI